MLAKNFIKRLLRDTRGATAVEYGLIVTLIVIAIIGAMQGFANEVIDMWGLIEGKYDTANNA